MNVWHCKKAGSEPDGYLSENESNWPTTNRTKSTAHKTQKTVAALLSDAIPVKFQFQFGK